MSAVRHLANIAVVFAVYGIGVVIENTLGVPAPIAGLVLFTAALTIWPTAGARIMPTAEVVSRWLPMLFVPLAVGGAAVVGEHSPIAIALAILVSVPLGFVVVALVAR